LTDQIATGLLVAAIVGLSWWRPALAVMVLGVFLFVQAAIVRVDALPDQLTTTLGRADELFLAALVVRSAAVWVLRRTPRLPKALWALAAFGLVGVVSAFVNGVSPQAAGLGLFLAAKAGLWLFVGLSLPVDVRVLARYGYLIGALFVGVVVIAALQMIGVPLPWQPYTRAGVTAATSIWNFHTAFGGAMSVGVGLSVVALRLPSERIGGAVLAVSSVIGVLLSTARRLLVSLVVGAGAALVALPTDERRHLWSAFSVVRRPAVLVAVLVVLALAAVTVGPRLVNLASLTWERYVVELPSRDRYQLYAGAFQLVQESPLVGRGPATFGSYASVVFDSPAYEEVGYERPRASMVVGGQTASVIAEYGILGFLAFAAFLVLLIRELVPVSRGSSGTVRAALAAGGIFMIANMVVESFVNPVFSNSFITFFSFVGIGIAITLYRLSEADPTVGAWEPERFGDRWRTMSVLGAALLLVVLGVTVGVAVST
jgi:O-antigen ligase